MAVKAASLPGPGQLIKTGQGLLRASGPERPGQHGECLRVSRVPNALWPGPAAPVGLPYHGLHTKGLEDPLPIHIFCLGRRVAAPSSLSPRGPLPSVSCLPPPSIPSPQSL